MNSTENKEQTVISEREMFEKKTKNRINDFEGRLKVNRAFGDILNYMATYTLNCEWDYRDGEAAEMERLKQKLEVVEDRLRSLWRQRDME